MTAWSSGYVTEIPYTYNAYRELGPGLLCFAALSAGIAGPSVDADLSYCELGCGQGVSANILAAANPRIDFHAVDFNPTHIAGARSLAAAARTPNVHFYDDSFAEFAARRDLPAFDIVALHGVYSWVSAENRRVIVDFLRDRLKVGGLVYVSYNALPGWAPMMPLRQLMAGLPGQGPPGQGPGVTAERIDRAIAYVERLKSIDSAYLRANPAVVETIDRIRDQNKSYLAHEYFNRDLTAFYHSDVAADFAEGKLSFLCSATFAEHLTVASLTADQKSFLASIANVSERETLRDFIVNQRFRRDVFIKGAAPLSPGEIQERWDATRFVLTSRREDVSLRIRGPLGEANLKEEIYAPILDRLAAGPCTTRELLRDVRIAAAGRGAVQQALTVLVALTQVQPAPDAEGESARAASTRAFNDAVIQKSRSDRNLLYLASPVTGTPVGVERIPQLFLLALGQGHDDPPAFVWAELDRFGHKVARDGKALETADENLAELRERYLTFQRRALPILEMTGIA